MPEASLYKRVVLKLSGEAMAGSSGYGFDAEAIDALALQVEQVYALGIQVSVLIGGGNLWRGTSGSRRLDIDRVSADYMGMLGTAMNGLAFRAALERLAIPVRVQSAIDMKPIAETYVHRRAMRHLEKGRIVLFVAGTGSPYFSSDTTAALRAAEIGADLIIKATQVDGVYTADPRQDSSAKRFPKISYEEYLQRGLTVLDMTAVALCRDNRIPIIVLSLADPANMKRALLGEDVGTVIG